MGEADFRPAWLSVGDLPVCPSFVREADKACRRTFISELAGVRYYDFVPWKTSV
jgi:hypothetical protein